MSGQTVRFIGEFDDTKLIEGVRRATSTIASLADTKQITLFGPEVLQDLDKLEQSTNALEQSFTGLDSASTGISGSFDEIGNAANQAGDNFNTLGTSGATVEQQLAEIGTTSVTAGQSMSALGGSADTTATSMGALQSNFEGVSGGLTDTNTLFGETVGKMSDVDDQSQTTGERMQKMWSKGSSIAIGISATISGIANLVRGFRDYGDAQVRVQKANLAVSKGQEAVTKAQEKYNAAVAEFGPNSTEAQKALVDLGQAQESLTIKQETQEKAVRRAGDAQVDIWLGLASTVTGIGGSIIQSLDAIGGEKGFTGLIGKMKGVMPAADSLGLSLLGLGAAFGIVGGGIALAIILLQQDSKLMEEFAAQGVKLTKVQQDGNKAFAEMNHIMDVTHMTMAQVIADPGAAAAAYKAMGGEVSATGEIATTSKDQWDSSRSGLQILIDTIFGVKPATVDAAKGIDQTNKAVATAADVTKSYIPTIIKLESGTRQLGVTTFESYTRGGKALNFFGVEQQKNTVAINASYKAWKQATQGTKDFTGAIEPNTKALQANGIALFKAAEPLPTFIKNQDILTGAIVDTGTKIKEYEGHLVEMAGATTKVVGPTKEMELRLQKIAERAAGVTKFQTDFTSSLTSSHDALFKQAQELGGNELAMAKFGITTNSTDATIISANKGLVGYIHTLGGVTPEEQKVIDKNQEWINTVQEVADKYNTQLNPALVDTPEKLDAITKALEAHAKAMEDSKQAVEDAHEAFSELLDTTKVKDFNKALKELNLKETLGKDFNSAVKDLGPSITEFNNAMGSVQTGLQGLIEFGGKIDFKTFSGGLNTWVDSIEALAAADPDSRGQSVKALLESLRTMTPDEINQHAGSLSAFVKAALEGKDITPEQVTAFLAAFSAEKAANIGTAATNTTALGTAAGTAKGPIGEAGTAAGTAATQYDPLQTNILKTATAFDTLVNGIAKAVVTFPVPTIQPFTDQIVKVAAAWDTLVNGIQGAKVTVPALIISAASKSILTVASAFDKLVNGINKAKPVIHIDNSAAAKVLQNTAKAADNLINGINKAKAIIHVDNSQALKAINAVVSAMNKVKSKSVTLTTIKKTVTVGGSGRAAHMTTSAGGRERTDLMGGGEGGDEIVIPANITQSAAGGSMGMGMGDVNVTIINRDEFGTEKVRKYKAAMGKDRYLFGSVGAGG